MGRSKELIIKGGVNIAPRQIDDVLESHPAVLEAAAVGVPDRYFGEDAVAFVVLRSGCGCRRERVAGLLRDAAGPFQDTFAHPFPERAAERAVGQSAASAAARPGRSGRGGSHRAAGSEANHDAKGNTTPAATALRSEQLIAAAWAEVLAVPEVDFETNFFALGGHSLLAIQCLSKLRNKLPIVLSLADFFEHPTVAEQAELVKQRLRPAHGDGAPLRHSSQTGSSRCWNSMCRLPTRA